MTWYTCKRCPPHGIHDHSMYAEKRCCIKGCLCPGYLPDENKPIKPKKYPRRMDGPLPQK